MIIFVIFLAVTGIWSRTLAVVDEEALLRAKAALVARKIHVRNLNLIGIDSSTCKPRDDKNLYLDHMKRIKDGQLNHCPTLMETILKPLNEEIAKVDAGQLVFAPVPRPMALTQASLETNEDGGKERIDEQEEVTETTGEHEKTHVTGLSGEEIEHIFTSYDDNRKDFVTSEEDNLFDILSKAYVRNLNRLIERKRDDN